MVKQKDARFGNAAGDASDILDRDQMTERPLSEIHQTGPTAALDKCHALESTAPAVAKYYPKWYRGTEPVEVSGEGDHH